MTPSGIADFTTNATPPRENVRPPPSSTTTVALATAISTKSRTVARRLTLG